MADINDHTIQGRLAADPKIIRNDKGAIARLRVMTNYRYQDASGDWQTRDTGHTVIIRGDLAELVEDFKKGDPLLVIGFVDEREYTDGQGVKRIERQLIARKLYRPLLPQRRNRESNNDPEGARYNTPIQPRESSKPSGQANAARHSSATPTSSRPSKPYKNTVMASNAPSSAEDDVFADMDSLVRSRNP